MCTWRKVLGEPGNLVKRGNYFLHRFVGKILQNTNDAVFKYDSISKCKLCLERTRELQADGAFSWSGKVWLITHSTAMCHCKGQTGLKLLYV